MRKEERAKPWWVWTQIKKRAFKVTKNLLDENEEIQERMKPWKRQKGSTEAHAVKWGQERGEADKGKVMEQ